MPNPNILEIRNLSYNANRKDIVGDDLPLLNDISFKLPIDDCKNITAIIGPNGSGKSLLLRNIAGLLKPNSGEVLWFGKNSIKASEIAIVFQKPILLRRSVRANLEHALRAFKTPKVAIASRVNQLLEMGKLTALSQRPARLLSGGEQQRLALIRALASDPKILLLDEATASLDPQTTLMIENLITQVSRNGTKIIMVTHDLKQIERLANDVIFINQGKICEHSAAKLFLKKPNSLPAKNYISGKLIL